MQFKSMFIVQDKDIVLIAPRSYKQDLDELVDRRWVALWSEQHQLTVPQHCATLYPENHPGMEHVFSYNFEFLFDDYCTIIVKIRWPMFWLHNSPGNGVVSSSLVRAVGVASHAVALHAFAHAHVGTAD